MIKGALADHQITADQARVYCSKCLRPWAEILSQGVACQGNLITPEREALEAERGRVWQAVCDVATGSGPQ